MFARAQKISACHTDGTKVCSRIQHISLKHAPDTLLISLPRFENHGHVTRKNQFKITVSLDVELTLKSHLVQYHLAAVIFHIGNQLSGGM